MAEKPEQVSNCGGAIVKKAWRRLRRDAKRSLKRLRRRAEKRDPEGTPERMTKGWAD